MFELLRNKPVRNLREEMRRRNTKRQSMLRAFEKYGSLTTAELNRYGTGCSSRLKELRKDGHKIVAQYEKPGEFIYHYLGKVEDGC